MIKWFDANKFLPGKECGTVLIRCANNNGIYYEIGDYKDSEWFCVGINPIENETNHVTHWAFIEEPI